MIACPHADLERVECHGGLYCVDCMKRHLEKDHTKGWAQHQTSKFCHFFKDGASLCGRYFDGERVSPLTTAALLNFCPSCLKKLKEAT